MSYSTYSIVIDTPVSRLGIRCTDRAIVGINYVSAAITSQHTRNPLARKAEQALRRYFRDPYLTFELPLALAGTDFQRKVWLALTGIPAGETCTYGELAEQLGSGARAVGNACRSNPLSILVPCHRVVAATGLGGYSGAISGVRLRRKRWLLEHEGAI